MDVIHLIPARKRADRKTMFAAMSLALLLFSCAAWAYDPLPSDCDGACSGQADCLNCMSSCENYITTRASLPAIMDSIAKRLPITDPNLDPLTVKNLEGCWCSACCGHAYPGDANHPCIFQCPCTPKEAPPTSYSGGGPAGPASYNFSISEIIRTANFNICLILNIIWMVAGSIAALALILAGVKYLTSDDPVVRKRAKSRIIYAVTGLVLVFIACPVVDYLIENTSILPTKQTCKCFEMIKMPVRPTTTTSTTRSWSTTTPVSTVTTINTVGTTTSTGPTSSVSTVSTTTNTGPTTTGTPTSTGPTSTGTPTTTKPPTTSSTTTTSTTITTCTLPAYEPAKWNVNPALRCNNCYNYGCDIRTDNFAQPGYASGVSVSMSCSSVINGAKADGLTFLGTTNAACTGCTHKIALVVAPGQDFHWYRLDTNGMWSHKPGQTQARNTDESGNKISSPETCNRGFYTSFCGYFCVDKKTVNIRGSSC